MKKNIFRSSLILSSICALFSLCLLVKPNKVEKVSAISTSVPDLETYTPYEIYDGSFYFDWSFVTYDVSSSSNNNSNNRSLRVYSGTPSTLTGLLFVFNDSITSFGDYYSYDLDFYSYYYLNHNSYFLMFDSIVLNFSNILYKSNGNSVTVYNYQGWQGTVYSKQILFVGGTDIANNELITLLMSRGTFYYFYEFQDYVNQVSTLQGQVSSLQSQVSSLENTNASLNNQITSLNNQITSLNNQISSLNNQLNNAVLSARRDTYIVSINSELNYEFQIFVNVDYQSNQDFYVKPLRISCNSRIELFDCSSNLLEHYFNVVDVLDFSEVDVYYYNYSDLYNYLYIDIGDDWLLNIPYVDNDDVATFSLSNINYYISDWLLDYKSDLSYSDFAYSRRTFVNYNNLISGALSGTNMSYLDGYYAGIDEGYLQGKQDGYSQGVGDGFAAGSDQDATVATIFSGILQIAMVPVNFFLGIFNFEILGINMTSFVSALLTVAITIIIIRIVTGKKND